MLLWSCASTGRPSGGPKDTTPPSLVVEESSPNFSTNFIPQKIELVFDEWIELKNQAKEILISPPFFIKPKITQRGKKVTVEFPEEEPLRPDATYTLNFGQSIVDFTEANAVDGFRFLFATGDKLDSLTFGGTIVDAYGGDPVKEVLIMLYDVLGDSVVVSEKPFYYSRADDDGGFKFENLKNDTFKLIVIEDLNLNYLLDDELERLAFIDSTFILNDSSSFSPELRLFTPEQSTRIINSNSKTPGLITTVFNKKAELVDYEYLYPDSFDPYVETIGDTIKFWFEEPIDSAGIVYGLDTLDFTIKPFDTIFYERKIYIQDNNLTKSKLAPFDSLMLSFSTPIAIIDTSFITLSDKPKPILVDTTDTKKDSLLLGGQLDSLGIGSIDQDSSIITLDTLLAEQGKVIVQDNTQLDSTLVIDTLLAEQEKVIDQDNTQLDSTLVMDTLVLIEIDTMFYYSFGQSIDMRKLIIQNTWKQAHEYQLIILPGGVTDIYGRISDTIVFDFKTTSLDKYGNINLMVTELDSAEQYIVLLREDDKQIKASTISDLMKKQISFTRLPASTYNIHLIKDENRDGKWTTGDYWAGKQPELLKKYELEKLRENWDLEANVSWAGIVVDTLGKGADSSFIQVDSLGQPIKRSIQDGSKKPKRKKTDEVPNNKKGIRGRKG
ncbi:MAG: hypothetical protein ACI86M_001921 [Saprospiraceae bacterium]|jgi:hypothetical protein